MSIDFTPSLEAKKFFRFTGPPENWLTALKFMTWGLEEKYRDRWQEIQPGDVFFIHSTQKSLFKNAKSGILGIGVVGSNFSVKNNFLWIHEMQDQENRWPLLVPFSEIYLFSELPDRNLWQAPNPTNKEDVAHLVDKLLQNVIPLSGINGFPQMGSFSAVSDNVAKQILYDKKPLYVYSNFQNGEKNPESAKPTKLEEIKNVSETMRYADTLKVFEHINARIVKDGKNLYMKDNEFLAKAETVHATILQSLIDLLREKGYTTRSNRFVDLFAYNEEKSFLFEVKSTENNNFRSQARKGIVQLYEYEYFDIKKFVQENKLDFKEKHKILVPSQTPRDNNYVSFMNSLDIGVGMLEDKSLIAVGNDFGVSKM